MSINDIQFILSVAIQVVAVVPLVLFAVDFLSFARCVGGYEIPQNWTLPVSNRSDSLVVVSPTQLSHTRKVISLIAASAARSALQSPDYSVARRCVADVV
jgi:hypothetical protein